MTLRLRDYFRGLVMAGGFAVAPVGALAAPVSLACLPETPQTARLCAQLYQVIASARPDLDLRLVAADALADHPRALRLDLITLRDDGIVARLDWRGDGQDWQRGPEQSVRALDTALTQPMINQFLSSLWTQRAGGFQPFLPSLD